MERKLKFVFILTLFIVIVVSLVSNLYFDSQASKKIVASTLQLIDYAKTSDEANYMHWLKLDSLNSIDGLFASQRTTRADAAKLIFNEFKEKDCKIKKLNFFKLDRRTTAIAKVQLSAATEEKTLPMMFHEFESREGEKYWLPIMLIDPKMPYAIKSKLLSNAATTEIRYRQNEKKFKESVLLSLKRTGFKFSKVTFKKIEDAAILLSFAGLKNKDFTSAVLVEKLKGTLCEWEPVKTFTTEDETMQLAEFQNVIAEMLKPAQQEMKKP